MQYRLVNDSVFLIQLSLIAENFLKKGYQPGSALHVTKPFSKKGTGTINKSTPGKLIGVAFTLKVKYIYYIRGADKLKRKK